MNETKTIPVITTDGQRGVLGNADALESGQPVIVKLDNGRTLAVPPQVLMAVGDGSYRLDLHTADLEQEPVRQLKTDEQVVVPVLEEQLEVGKRQVPTGGVRIRKLIREHEEVVQQPLMSETVEVRRVTVNRVVDSVPAIQHVGDTMVIPLVEEVLRVEKQLMLREEIHVIRKRTVEQSEQRVSVRREEAEVDRLDSRGEVTAQPAVVQDEVVRQADARQAAAPAPVVENIAEEPLPALPPERPVRSIRKNKVIR